MVPPPLLQADPRCDLLLLCPSARLVARLVTPFSPTAAAPSSLGAGLADLHLLRRAGAEST
jgi:hypothetical protein